MLRPIYEGRSKSFRPHGEILGINWIHCNN